jgi:acyl-CoA synthetase (AMP-forming)/AMP-acid ligase II
VESTFSLVDALVEAAKSSRGIRFIEGDKEEKYVSYAGLLEKSRQVLSCFQEKGILPGTEIVFQLDNNENYIYTFCACVLGGMIPVPVTIVTNAGEAAKLQAIWTVLHNPYLVIERKLANRLLTGLDFTEELSVIQGMPERQLVMEELLEKRELGVIRQARSEELAYIQFSSGSTGTPKGVMLTHGNLVTNVNDMIYGGRITDADSTLSWLPLTHDLGLIGFFLTPLIARIDNFLMPTALFIRRPSLWMKKANEHKATITASPNFGYSYFLKRFKSKEAEAWDLSLVRLIVNGAEPISYELADGFLEAMRPYGLRRSTMFTVYGMAEACLGVAFPIPGEPMQPFYYDRSLLAPGNRAKVLVSGSEQSVTFVEEGYALPSVSIRICDEADNPLEEYTVGHIQIKGGNVTAGYYNNEDATAQAFSSDGWLRTGDIGFFQNKSLVVVGRSKDILFVNGQNFYSHDLERMAGYLDGIETAEVAVAGVFDSRLGRDTIIAFITHRNDLQSFLPVAGSTRASLNHKCGLALDEVIPVRKIPKTTSGKKQRYKLVEDYVNGVFDSDIQSLRELMGQAASDRERVLPETPGEEVLLRIWRDVLQREDFGITDSFFDLGGNSLKVTVMVSRVQAEMGHELPIPVVFNTPTIRELAAAITADSSGNGLRRIQPADSLEFYPLTTGQRRIYVQSQFRGTYTSYNIPVSVILEGKLTKERVSAAIESIVRRHDILRTSIVTVDGVPYQKIHSDAVFDLKYGMITEDETERIIAGFIRPFDLSERPLFRVGLYQIHAEKYLFILDMHHLISDGSSLTIFMNEFYRLYQGLELPARSIQYKDYAVWEHGVGNAERIVGHKEYWLKRFPGEIPRLNMPHDYSRPEARTFRGERLHFVMDTRLVSRLEAFSLEAGATPYMAVLSAYLLMLHTYTGQEDIVVGSPVACRTHADTQDMIGMFVNMLPFRVEVSNDASYADLLGKVKACTLEAYEHQEYPFDELVQQLGGGGDPNHNSVFSAALVFQNFGLPAMEGLKYSLYPMNTGTAQYDLLLSILHENGEMRGELEYSTDIYRRETAESMVARFMTILEQVLKHPYVPVGELRVVEESDSVLPENESYEDIIFNF